MPHLARLLPLAAFLLGCGGSTPTAPTTPTSPVPPTTPTPPPASTTGRYVADVFPSVTRTDGLVYGSAVPFGATAPAPLRLDLFQPDGDTASARPAIIWIHGGGFVAGNRADPAMRELATRFARKGYVTASIEYRLCTPAAFAADQAGGIRDAIHDARAAVRWLRANATTYRLDPTRIAIGGGSAGAYTALGVAYGESEGTSGNAGFSSEVRAVVDFWGGLPTIAEMEAGEAPLVIIHGTADATVPFSNAEALQARAQAVGIPSSYHPMAGAPHSHWTPMDQYMGWIAPFLRTHLGLP